MLNDTQNKLAVIILFLFSIFLYFNSLGNGFIFDDLHTIPDNLYIKDPGYIHLFFKGFYTSVSDLPKGMLRPLLMITFVFNYMFSGLNPLGYHLVNILVHFLNGLLLYLVIRIFNKNTPFGLGLFLSLLFIAHPLNTEAVNYISCRSDLLVTFFVLSAIFCYSRKNNLAALFLYILALLTKESALVFLILAVSYDFIYRQTSKTKPITRNSIIFYSGLVILTCFYWFWRMEAFHFGIKAITDNPLRSFWSNALLQSVISVFYLRLFIWPYPLNLHHAFADYATVFNPIVFFSLVFIFICFILIFVCRRKYPLLSFGISWYLICLSPKFYAVLHFPAMEHHSYLPSVGIYFVLGVILLKIYRKFKKLFIYFSVLTLGIFAILVWVRNYEWSDPVRFYEVAVKRSPNSAVAHNNLGIEYLKKDFMDFAEKEFKAALSLSNSVDIQVNCRINLSRIYANKEDYDLAVKVLNDALTIKNDFYKIYQALGFIYIQKQDKERAKEVWLKGLRFNPYSSGLLDNLGVLALEKNNLEEAKMYFQSAISNMPDDFTAHFGLGEVLEWSGDIDGAVKEYEKSVSLNPAYSHAHYALAALYLRQSDRRALWHLKETVRIAPDFAQAHNDLAVLYASLIPPKIDLAVEHAKKALSLGYAVDEEFLKILNLPEFSKDKY